MLSKSRPQHLWRKNTTSGISSLSQQSLAYEMCKDWYINYGNTLTPGQRKTSSITSILSFYPPFYWSRASRFMFSSESNGRQNHHCQGEDERAPSLAIIRDQLFSRPCCHTKQAYIGARCGSDARVTNRAVSRTGGRLRGFRLPTGPVRVKLTESQLREEHRLC